MKWLLRSVVLLSCRAISASAEPNEMGPEIAAQAVNSFAAAHYKLQPPGNTLTSPFSIQTCLAMSYAGASGKTLEAMRKAFFYPLDESALPASFRTLRQSLTKPPHPGEAPLDIRIANRVYYADGLKAETGWQEATNQNYFADAQAIDFQAPGAEGQINQWVDEKTNHKISAIVPPGGLSTLTHLVLVNASYFDLPWDERFSGDLTHTLPFYIDPKHGKTIPLMFKQHRLRYAKKEGFQIAALPYTGSAYQFVVFVPDAIDGLARMERLLTARLFSECTALDFAEVRLTIPKLRVEPPIAPLESSLRAMGAEVMFSAKADFSRMIKEPVSVGQVYHRCYLELDENGTRAAAATAVEYIRADGHPRQVSHVQVTADHPFVYLIQHVPSGACIFLGRITDPAPDVQATVAAPALRSAERDEPKK